MEAILSLGSNLGDRRAHLLAARVALAQLPGSRLAAVAPLYETEPVDVPPAYRGQHYLNTIVVIETTLSAEALAARLHDIEAALGRVRGAERHAPRTIDIDLIACGDRTSDLPELRLPHPQAARRRFVCQPLSDVRPDLRLPGQRLTIRELLASLPPLPAVARAAEQWPPLPAALENRA